MRIYHIDEERIKFIDDVTRQRHELHYAHEQDCCEEVYADFESIPRYFIGKDGTEKDVYKVDFEEDLEKLIEEVEGQGFMLCTKNGDKVLCNCYDIQNGWYSSNLAVILYEVKAIASKEIKEMIHEDKD